jgi:hypothetical protein
LADKRTQAEIGELFKTAQKYTQTTNQYILTYPENAHIKFIPHDNLWIIYFIPRNATYDKIELQYIKHAYSRAFDYYPVLKEIN